MRTELPSRIIDMNDTYSWQVDLPRFMAVLYPLMQRIDADETSPLKREGGQSTFGDKVQDNSCYYTTANDDWLTLGFSAEMIGGAMARVMCSKGYVHIELNGNRQCYADDQSAYTALGESLRKFIPAVTLQQYMIQAGIEDDVMNWMMGQPKPATNLDRTPSWLERTIGLRLHFA